MTMRNMISAMANKIEPNPDGFWSVSATSVEPGSLVTVHGDGFRFGNIRFGFDNNNDFVPDYNAWIQPVGDPSFDPSCFRLVETTGNLLTKRGSGNPDLIENFADKLYFTNFPSDNTDTRGDVDYTFLVLNGPCNGAASPYQEVASGFDNEKFNGDYGNGTPALISSAPKVTLDKTASVSTVAAGGTIGYTLAVANTGSSAAGAPQYGAPLVISDAIPTGTQYVAGSANSTIGGDDALLDQQRKLVEPDRAFPGQPGNQHRVAADQRVGLKRHRQLHL